jgi:alpha-amylase
VPLTVHCPFNDCRQVIRKHKKYAFTGWVKALLCGLGCMMCARKGFSQTSNEVIYHVFERSFYDNNGDGTGDLKGLRSQLSYLQHLGITSLLLTPLYASVFYHNYFADDFQAVDPAYGSMKELFDLIREVHKRGMKIYLDMETQYVTETHSWWKAAYGDPHSSFSHYLLFDDSLHVKPSPMMLGITELKGYDGTVRKIAMVNLHAPEVLAYNERLFGFFVDPDKNGKFDDGVDGFRLDHMMDDLDDKPQLTDLFSRFWVPLFSYLRHINPRLVFTAEQANWASFGADYFSKATVDRVFAFRLGFAIQSFNKHQLQVAADSTLVQLPEGKQQVVFIENHDVDRFASRVRKDPGKERVGADLNLLIGGIPAIYYGQELGMTGSGGFGKFGISDGNDIPRREAFEWFAADTGKGMALWYKGTGPWWDSTNIKPYDGISLQEEREDSGSLYKYYRALLSLRSQNAVLAKGRYQASDNPNPMVFSFCRVLGDKQALVAVNLSDSVQKTSFPALAGTGGILRAKQVFGAARPQRETVEIPPYGIGVWLVQ